MRYHFKQKRALGNLLAQALTCKAPETKFHWLEGNKGLRLARCDLIRDASELIGPSRRFLMAVKVM